MPFLLKLPSVDVETFEHCADIQAVPTYSLFIHYSITQTYLETEEAVERETFNFSFSNWVVVFIGGWI